jgi:hypothetical protein
VASDRATSELTVSTMAKISYAIFAESWHCLNAHATSQMARSSSTTLLTITTLSGWQSSGVVIAKFPAQVVAFRSSPTVLAETPVDWSALTRIRSGKPPRARWSAATFFGLYRMTTSPIRSVGPSFATAQQNYIICSGPTQRHLVVVVPLVAAVVEEAAA